MRSGNLPDSRIHALIARVTPPNFFYGNGLYLRPEVLLAIPVMRQSPDEKALRGLDGLFLKTVRALV
ncbi:hypothetical protein [Desulfopila aestuarii]|uniref:hypothetical protein n=1 Tax=Desulfopila aestuarii TaxID=231440 RepID=UPI001160FD9A|nr:hypothetical protein [Desulfopila aestuarii]